MFVSILQLAKRMTERLVSQITRASFSSTVGASHMEEETKHFVSRNVPRDTSYEDAVKALHNLQSNAETIAKARLDLNKKVINNIPNMMEDVDKLSVIHVSGTKGKGSTCALCERILYFHGYKTGLFTSPHMIEVRERIRINGKPISQQLFSKYFWKVYNNLQISQTEGIDVAVVEVGIGGQYDSTNFFRKPVVCGITSLGLDHTALLGNTITEIAWNKAGILKPGRPAVTVHHEHAALEVIRKRAHEIQSPLYIAKEMSKEFVDRQNIKLGIAGAKQVENASLAIQLFHIWEEVKNNGRVMNECIPAAASSVEELPQLETSELDVATLKGLSACVWPGRAQTIRRGDITYYLDGAHTKESMQVCAQWFTQAVKREEQSNKKFARVLLFNTTSDRDVGSLMTCLMGCNFDAAIFSTNMLSVVESVNRADQLNKNVTLKWMMEKVDSNRSIWEELVVKTMQHSSVMRDCDSSGCAESEMFYDIKSNIVLDHNLNSHLEITKEAVQLEIRSDYVDSCIKKRKVSPAAFADSQTDNVFQSDSQIERLCSSLQNNITTDGKSVLPETVNCITAQDICSGDDTQLNKPLINGDLQSLISHDDLNSEMSCPKNVTLSMKFSCILHALEWVTQGRDHAVTSCDPDFCLPSLPRELSDADHLQILITGSLHLVGGVLGVVDPQMND